MILDRFLYFLFHPSEYLGLWTLDATVLFSVLTLLVVLRQLALMTEQTSLMKHQDNLMQRQTEIVVRQDETNREVLARRVQLRLFTEPSPPAVLKVLCRNEGNKTAQSFYWHLSVPADVRGVDVQDGLGNGMLYSFSVETHDTTQYRHYTGFIDKPLYPTRDAPVARINTPDMKLPLWWTTVSEDGSDPTPDGKMQRIDSA